MNDKEIEQEIKDKGLTAPRITLEHIESVIALESYATGEQVQAWVLGPAYTSGCETALHLLTWCVLVLKNGFTVTGESACASPENFDAELGRKIARQKAIDKVWMLEGYLLKQDLHEQAPARRYVSGVSQ